MEKGTLDSDVTTLVTGSLVPSEILVPSGEESMDQTPEPEQKRCLRQTKRNRYYRVCACDFKMIFFLSQVIKTTEDWSRVYSIEFVSFGF